MKLFFVSILSLFLMGAGYQTLSLDEVVSIIQTPNGQFDVLCKDHSRELVSKEDLLNNNICPHQPTPQLPMLDILFVIDNSGSMSSSQQKLSSYAEEMIRDLVARKIDFQIAITTTEAYKADFIPDPSLSLFKSYNGQSILNSDTPHIIDVFKQLILQGTNGSGDERAFHSFKASLENPQNSNFLRTGAQLRIYILSDEDDFSHKKENYDNNYNNPNLYNMEYFTEYLDQATQSPNPGENYSVSAIAIFDEACKTQMDNEFGGRKIGYRYQELVDATGGEKISLCDLQIPQF
ncbi:MAG: VWA domain-containing protein [Bdellovibrionales bacterium]|nr:VWA domain-containing protein [Bdellovibrionales bacterium]